LHFIGDLVIDKALSNNSLVRICESFIRDEVLVRNRELITEGVAPVIILSEVAHSALVAPGQELLGQVQ